MEKELQDLLLKDLCARLPYGVYAKLPNHNLVEHTYFIESIDMRTGWTCGVLKCAGREQIYSAKVEDVKPYLRPLSSMTYEESLELSMLSNDKFKFYLYTNEHEIISLKDYNYLESLPILYWLIAHHFDIWGLIPMGLALEAPNGMYNN